MNLLEKSDNQRHTSTCPGREAARHRLFEFLKGAPQPHVEMMSTAIEWIFDGGSLDQLAEQLRAVPGARPDQVESILSIAARLCG